MEGDPPEQKTSISSEYMKLYAAFSLVCYNFPILVYLRSITKEILSLKEQNNQILSTMEQLLNVYGGDQRAACTSGPAGSDYILPTRTAEELLSLDQRSLNSTFFHDLVCFLGYRFYH